MKNSTQLRFAPAVTSMRDYLKPHVPWLERVVGCPLSQTVTLEVDTPIQRFVGREMLRGVPLDADPTLPKNFETTIARWELAQDTPPRIFVLRSKTGTHITASEPAWRITSLECPVAVWLKGEQVAFVAADIPFVSYEEGLVSKWKSWVITNRSSVSSLLNWLLKVPERETKYLTTFGGDLIALPSSYDWGSVIMDASTAEAVKNDFESLFKRERWLRDHGLPFRRGYFFYGAPGNGKTSAIKAMASHPAITPFTLDFHHELLTNGMLTRFLDDAAHNSPALVIFEDIDRAFTCGNDQAAPPKITLQHLLNCLDGITTQDGVIVVATANNPSLLDPAILRRPGRFDRVVEFRSPDAALRVDYLKQLSRGELGGESLKIVSGQADGFSFAQLREAYIVAGQLAFESCSEIDVGLLLSGVTAVRSQNSTLRNCGAVSKPGFAVPSSVRHHSCIGRDSL